MQVIVSFVLTDTTANNFSNHNCTVYIHMLTIYRTAHNGIQKYLFKTIEMTVNNETTMVNCWLGLAWLVYQGSGVHKVKYQTKFDKVRTTIFLCWQK